MWHFSPAVSYTHLDVYKRQVQSSEWTGFQFVDAGSKDESAPEIKTEGAAIEQIKMCIRDSGFRMSA